MIEEAWDSRVGDEGNQKGIQEKLMVCEKGLVNWSKRKRLESEFVLRQNFRLLRNEQEEEGSHNVGLID